MILVVRLLNLLSSAGILTRAFVSLAYIRFHKVRQTLTVRLELCNT